MDNEGILEQGTQVEIGSDAEQVHYDYHGAKGVALHPLHSQRLDAAQQQYVRITEPTDIAGQVLPFPVAFINRVKPKNQPSAQT